MDTARWGIFQELVSEGDMQNLASLASEGTRFTNCTANGPWTLPSHASMFSGLRTSTHGSHAGTKTFDPPTTPIAEALRQCGYQTIAYSNNTWVSPEFGFDTGFEDFLVRWEIIEGGGDLAKVEKLASVKERFRELLSQVRTHGPSILANFCYALYLNFRNQNDSGAERTVRRLGNWFTQEHDPERPFFAFVNFVEPHLPYQPSKKFAKPYIPEDVSKDRVKEVNQDPWAYICGTKEMNKQDFKILRGLYKGELAYLDTKIGDLFDVLREKGFYENTLIAIVGDHGENIGDHGLMDHQFCLYETLVQVPCILRHPEHFPSGQALDGPIELRDLYPTFLEVAGIETDSLDAITADNSLIHPKQKEYCREYVISEYLEPQPSQSALRDYLTDTTEKLERFDRALRAIKNENWKLVEGTDNSIHLYEYTQNEELDVTCSNPQLVDKLQSKVERECGTLVRSPGTDDIQPDISEDTKNRLEELGYLQ